MRWLGLAVLGLLAALTLGLLLGQGQAWLGEPEPAASAAIATASWPGPMPPPLPSVGDLPAPPADASEAAFDGEIPPEMTKEAVRAYRQHYPLAGQRQWVD